MDQIDRGIAAQRLLDDELLKEALDTLENHAMARLKMADVNDTKTLQTLVMGLQAASGFRRQLDLALRYGEEAIKNAEKEAQSPVLRTLKKLSSWT